MTSTLRPLTGKEILKEKKKKDKELFARIELVLAKDPSKVYL